MKGKGKAREGQSLKRWEGGRMEKKEAEDTHFMSNEVDCCDAPIAWAKLDKGGLTRR